VGLIPDDVIAFSIDLILTTALNRLTEMSTRNLPGGKGRPARKPDNLTVQLPRKTLSKFQSRNNPCLIKAWKHLLQ
jgi:hypothetical protein